MASTDHSRRNSLRTSSSASALVALAFGLLTLSLGRDAVLAKGLVNWDGLYAVSAAYTVIHAQERPSLSMIGFAYPPLATLLLTPVAWLAPAWCIAGVAQVLLGATAIFVAVWWLLAWMTRLGLPFWASVLFVTAVFLHPLVLSLYAGGSPTAVFFTLMLIGLGALSNWALRLTLRDLITASLFLGLAALCDTIGMLVVAAATVVVAVRAALAGRLVSDGTACGEGRVPLSRWAWAEGNALLFAMLSGYMLLLWVIASWAIIGDPWASWRHWVQQSGRYLGHLSLLSWLTLGCGGWIGAVVLSLFVRREDLRAAAWAVLATGVIAFLFLLRWTPEHWEVTWDWGMSSGPVLAAKAAAVVLLAIAFAEAVGRAGVWWCENPARLVGLALLILVAGLSVLRGLAGGWPAKPAELLQGRIGLSGSTTDARAAVPVVQRVVASAGPKARVYVTAGDAPAFAVGLFVGLPWRITDLPGEAGVRAGDFHVILDRGKLIPEDNCHPLETAWRQVRPVYQRHEAGFAIYAFASLGATEGDARVPGEE